MVICSRPQNQFAWLFPESVFPVALNIFRDNFCVIISLRGFNVFHLNYNFKYESLIRINFL